MCCSQLKLLLHGTVLVSVQPIQKIVSFIVKTNYSKCYFGKLKKKNISGLLYSLRNILKLMDANRDQK